LDGLLREVESDPPLNHVHEINFTEDRDCDFYQMMETKVARMTSRSGYIWTCWRIEDAWEWSRRVYE
jgi:hypothetical protein